MSDGVFDGYGAYYDLLYGDKDYDGEADYVTRTIRAAQPAARTMLEFGSGTGRHGRLMAERGFDVMGVERSQTMVSFARAGGRLVQASDPGRFDCVVGDIRAVSIDREFDAVVSLFHVVSYQTTNDELRQTFAAAARHLRPGGVFFFDVWHGPAVLSDRPATRIKRVEDAGTRLWRLAEPSLDLDASVVTVAYTILAESKADRLLTTLQEVHRMRYLFPTEIDAFAGQSGFSVERAEEFMTRREPSDGTFGVAYLLRKRA